MSAEASAAAVIVAPLLGAVGGVLVPRPWMPAFGALAAVITLGFAADVAGGVLASGTTTHTLGGWGAPAGIVLRADGLAAAMLGLVAVVGTAVTVYATAHLDRAQSGFFPAWLFGWGALNALFLSGDLFNLYVTLELATLSAVAMVVVSEKREALSAALRYLLLAMAGSLAYLLGVALLYGAYGVLDLEMLADRVEPGVVAWTALAAMTVGLAVKAALFPLHAWLAPAHSNAPAPASAVLSALIVKGAFVVMIRLWVDVFPPAAAASGLGWLGAAAVFWGSLLAIRQRRLKLLVAYSTVAQLGYLFLLFPIGTPGARAGGVYLAMAHGAAKASMFLAAGSIHHAAGHDEIARLGGVAQRLPLTFLAIGIAGISLVGLPPTGGFVGKWLLLTAAIDAGQWWWAVVLLLGGLLTALYVGRVVRPAFVPVSDGARIGTVPRVEELATLALALVALALGLAPTLPLVLLGGGP